jgi:hypothetical protein
MPIGIDAGARGRTAGPVPGPPGPPVARPPEPTRPAPQPPNPAPLPPSLPPGEPSTRVDTTPDLEVVVWTVWRTAADERVCPVCGPLDGMEWPSDVGPQPPAHPNCRCQRLVSRTELRVRT